MMTSMTMMQSMKGVMIRITSYDDGNDDDDDDDLPSESYHSRTHRGLDLYSRMILQSDETQGTPVIILIMLCHQLIML